MHTISHSHSNSIRWIGFLLLLAMASYLTGTLLFADITAEEAFLVAFQQNPFQPGTVAVLYLVNSFAVVGIGIHAYITLRSTHPKSALTYLITRFFEATLLAVGFIALLTIGTVADAAAKTTPEETAPFYALASLATSTNWYAYQTAMSALGFGSIPFCLILLKSGIMPKLLVIVGLVGYAILGVASISSMLGYNLPLLITLPVFVFEVVGGFWLLIRGLPQQDIPSAP